MSTVFLKRMLLGAAMLVWVVFFRINVARLCSGAIGSEGGNVAPRADGGFGGQGIGRAIRVNERRGKNERDCL